MAETKHEFDSKTSDLFKEIGSSLLDDRTTMSILSLV